MRYLLTVLLLAITAPAQAQECAQTTGSDMTLIIPGEITAPTSIDAIEAMADTLCVGRTAINAGTPASLTIWGDNALEAGRQGLLGGEGFTLYSIDGAERLPLSVTVVDHVSTDARSLTYAENSILRLTALEFVRTAGAGTIQFQVPSSTWLPGEMYEVPISLSLSEPLEVLDVRVGSAVEVDTVLLDLGPDAIGDSFEGHVVAVADLAAGEHMNALTVRGTPEDNTTILLSGLTSIPALAFGQMTHAMTVDLPCDVNNDGALTVEDVLAVVHHLNGRQPLDSASLDRADCAPYPGGNGTVDHADLLEVNSRR